MSGRSPFSTTATTILAGLLVAFVCARTSAQESAAGSEDEAAVEDLIVTPAEARFEFIVIRPEAESEDSSQGDEDADSTTTLEAAPAGLGGNDEEESDESVFTARAWLMHDASVAEPPDDRLDWAGAEVVRLAPSPRERARRVTARTSGVYGLEASQLTPLSGGKEMFSLELLQGLTLAGVGSRRMWTERDRAFVLAAEAGWKLSPHAGLHVGYEVLQTPLGGAMPEDAGDSIFARFQLRF